MERLQRHPVLFCGDPLHPGRMDGHFRVEADTAGTRALLDHDALLAGDVAEVGGGESARSGGRQGCGATVNGSVDFRWSPEPGDWRDALRSAVPVFRWAPWFAFALLVLSVVVLFMDMTVAGVFGLVLAIVIAVMVPVRVQLGFRNHPLAASTVTATADDHSLRMSIDEGARSELAWDQLPAWSETARGFVLRTTEGARGPMYAVPYRAFDAEESRVSFRALLVDHVGPAT